MVIEVKRVKSIIGFKSNKDLKHVRNISVKKPIALQQKEAKKVTIQKVIKLQNTNNVVKKVLRQGTPQKIFKQSKSDVKLESLRQNGKGRILIIIGNGPSHKEVQLQDLRTHTLIDMMSINKPDSRVWPTKYWLFCDPSQILRHKDLWNQYHGILINTSSIKEHKQNTISLKSNQTRGFSLDLNNGVHIGRSSVYVGIQVGVWMNYEHIFIIGCDMSRGKDGKLYPWGSNPDVNDDAREKRFADEAKHFSYAGQHLNERIRKKITFVSSYNKWDFLRHFGHAEHSGSVALLLKHADALLSSIAQQQA